MRHESSGDPLRIVLVGADLSTGGGVNRVMRDLSEILSKRLNAKVTVVSARSDSLPTYSFPPGVRIEYHRRGGLLSYLNVLWSIRQRHPDFVIGLWTQENILLTVLLLFSGVRSILCEHAPWYFHRLPIRVLRWLIYPFGWRVTVLNPRELSHYRRHLGNVLLLPNPVLSVPAPVCAKRGKLIVAVGHLESHKNFEDAIRAMTLSGLEKHGWSLAIIGDGSNRGELERLIERSGLVRTRIHSPTTEIRSWYESASLILVTSRLEAFSLALAEAMSAGVVPLAYAADGPSFILRDFPEHLVAVGDYEGLAERMAHFANESDLATLRNSLHNSIQQRFSPDVIAREWQTLLCQQPREIGNGDTAVDEAVPPAPPREDTALNRPFV